jgi:3-oxoacyl-[acyl-carrier-protein] synthase-1
MNRPAFLGAGIATHLGTGIAANLTGLHRAPPPPQWLERRLDDRVERIPVKLLRGSPTASAEERLFHVIDAVIEEAIRDSGLASSERRRMALCVGSSSFDIGVSEGRYRTELARGGDVLPLRSSSFGNLAEVVRARFGFQGEDYTFNTACTASANGLGCAARLIQAGVVDHAMVLGVELLNDLTALGFFGLGLLSRSEMKPFDSDRDGFVLGESCSALVLGPGDRDRFHWRGDANMCDTTSMVAANPDGSTIRAVIERALADAGLDPLSIAAVKAHGTASPSNDEAEAAGLLSTFAPLPPVCALKPFIGHSLGACGLTELILFYRAIESGFLIATPGIGADAAALGLALNQVERAMSHGHFLLNSFGFGGNNTAIVISRV